MLPLGAFLLYKTIDNIPLWGILQVLILVEQGPSDRLDKKFIIFYLIIFYFFIDIVNISMSYPPQCDPARKFFIL